MESATSPKRQRATWACDFCHSRGLKCRRGEYNLMSGVSEHALSIACLTCADYGVECTVNRPLRKRGRRKLTGDNTVGTSTEVRDQPMDRRYKTKPLDETKFGSQDIIRRLVQIYHDTMYPKYASFPIGTFKSLPLLMPWVAFHFYQKRIFCLAGLNRFRTLLVALTCS